MTVLFLVIGFYLGFFGVASTTTLDGRARSDDRAGRARRLRHAAVMKYQRQSLIYQKQLTDNIYFRNVNNNAGIFDYIIGAAEEQECKEAFLAYYFLQRGTLTSRRRSTGASRPG